MSKVFEGYRVTSPYGWRNNPFGTGGKEFHTGIDLVKSHKAPIYAFLGGEVLFAGEGKTGTGLGGYGNVVVIKDNKGHAHVYAHLDSVSVKKGNKVKKGQEIGKQGTTGRSTGSHLHYEIRKKCSPSYGWIADRANNCFEPTGYLERFTEKGSTKAKKTLYLPSSADTWTVYELDKPPVKSNKSNHAGTLKPSKFGGLEYEILGQTQDNVYIINTANFGKVQIYAHPSTGAIIK